jgi:hypothetical protein
MSFSKLLAFCSLFLTLTAVVENPVLAQNTLEPWKGAYTSEPFADNAIRGVYCDLVNLVEGSFGALLFIVAGILGITLIAFGDMKNAATMLVVAISAVTIGTGISLYFGDLGCSASSSNTSRSNLSLEKNISNSSIDDLVDENIEENTTENSDNTSLF